MMRITALALACLVLTPMDGWATEAAPEMTTEDPAATPTDDVPIDEVPAPPAEVSLPDPPQPVRREPTTTMLYDDARAALGRGDRDLARTLLRRLRRRDAGAWETAALASRLGQATPAEEHRLEQRLEQRRAGGRLDYGDYGREPRQRYSRATGERLKMPGWEAADFAITGLAYGAAIGAAYSIGFGWDDDSVFAPMVIGTMTYGVMAATFLAVDEPDRGDLPLALGITSYVPLTALLLGAAADVHDDEDLALAIALSGTFALPVAGIAAAYTDLDPGDTQLTRDAGFWGLTLALSSTAGFACGNWGCDGSTYGLTGLVGLYAGLGAGALLAAHTEMTLERVRATTLFGYGGALCGAVIGGVSAEEEGIWRGVALGSVVGLALGALATLSTDDIPDNAIMVGRSFVLMPLVDRKGGILPAVGVELSPH